MRTRRILLLFFAITAICALVIIRSLTRRENLPPDPGTPAPDPHSGSFVCDIGTLTFSGDGESIEISVSEELAALSGLPQGEHKGTYDFLSGGLPPFGSVPVRYDVAHELKITIDGSSVILNIGTSSADGSTYTVAWNTVTDDCIPVVCKKDGKYINIIFKK